MLVDHQIERAINTGRLIIDPWTPSMLQPASIDLHLDRFFRMYRGSDTTSDPKKPIDPKSPERRTFLRSIEPDETFTLRSMGFCLASTIERVQIPNNMVGRVEGKSSVGRLGLFVHITAGFMDPGFDGWTTLELFNAAPFPIILYPGMPICQMGFDYSAEERTWEAGVGYHSKCPEAKRPYRGKYQNQAQGPQESMYFQNFQKEQ